MQKGAYSLQRLIPMLSTQVDWKKNREELKDKRERLFAAYLKQPSDTSLAREIKLLDDQVAECNVELQRERRSKI